MRNYGILFHAFFLLILGPSIAQENSITTTQAQADSEGKIQVVRSQVSEFSEDQAKDFLQRVALRQVAAERGEMLRQLLSEKVALHKQILESLKLTYEWSPESSYRFDEDAKALLLLPTETEGDNAKEHNKSEEKVIHTFDSDDLERFRRLLTAKKQLEGQATSLTALLSEQLQIISKIRDSLKNSFNVDPNKQYHYDHKQRVLYLLSNGSDD